MPLDFVLIKPIMMHKRELIPIEFALFNAIFNKITNNRCFYTTTEM